MTFYSTPRRHASERLVVNPGSSYLPIYKRPKSLMGIFHMEHERFLSLVHLLYPGHGFRGSSEAIFVGVDLLRSVVVGKDETG